MEDYTIEEVLDIDFNEDYVIIKFKLEIDCIDEYRILEIKEYYDWCLEDYQDSEHDDIIDYEEDGHINKIFDYNKWVDTYKDSDYVLDFIYENYIELSDLPDIFVE